MIVNSLWTGWVFTMCLVYIFGDGVVVFGVWQVLAIGAFGVAALLFHHVIKMHKRFHKNCVLNILHVRSAKFN